MPSRPTGKPKTSRRDDDDEDDDADDAAPAPAPRGGRISIGLVDARGQHLRWVLIGLIIGGLCVYALGTLAQIIGVGLIGLGAWNGWLLVRALRNPPGTVLIDGDRIELPRGLCRGAPHAVGRAEVTAAYFLRRSVPWTQAGPVLVIEAGGQAFIYPRDWFGSESDQRRILDELTPA